MNSISNKQLLDALNWRYATKFFDETKKIPDDVWQTLERALILTPTSYGLQPYHFIVMTSAEKRSELMAHSWKQKQVVQCSHYVVFAARKKVTESDVDHWIQHLSEVRKVPLDSLKEYRGTIIGDVVHGLRSVVVHEWATRQAYIALGNLMTCAAMLGVDACPMEGFVPAEYDRVLELEEMGYGAVVNCALGYRSEKDKYAGVPKARFEASDLIRKI
ncbi:MAG TPA: NAD(P)H-dependent oxidoreductase [Verrucomicrobiae bacterium]|nr:NAD(P)H-dependent oxidoreductase [Verrucomicrobiae bacterium]